MTAAARSSSAFFSSSVSSPKRSTSSSSSAAAAWKIIFWQVWDHTTLNKSRKMKRKRLRITSTGTIAREHKGIGYKYWPNWLKREYDWEDRNVSINSQKMIEGTCLCVTNRRGCDRLLFDGGSSLNNDTTPFFRNTTRVENQLNEKQTLWKLLQGTCSGKATKELYRI